MDDELPMETDSLPTLPPQVRLMFPKELTESQELYLRLIYAGNKNKPNFIEWVEHYLVNDYLRLVLEGKTMIDSIKEQITEMESQDKTTFGVEENKQWDNRYKMLQKNYDMLTAQRLAFQKELRVATQTNLSRETPKKVEMTQIRVTPGDVANIINNAKRTIDITKEEEQY